MPNTNDTPIPIPAGNDARRVARAMAVDVAVVGRTVDRHDDDGGPRPPR